MPRRHLIPALAARARREIAENSVFPLICMLLAVLMLIPFNRPMLGMTGLEHLVVGTLAVSGFIYYLCFEAPERQALYPTLAFPLIILALARISTDLNWNHILVLAICFVAVLIIPPYVLKGKDIITYKFWPDNFDWVNSVYPCSHPAGLGRVSRIGSIGALFPDFYRHPEPCPASPARLPKLPARRIPPNSALSEPIDQHLWPRFAGVGPSGTSAVGPRPDGT